MSDLTTRDRLALAAVLALAAMLVLPWLGSNGLHTLDEARHATVAENILLSGDWIGLTYEDAPYANKPPLKFWLTALTYRAFGVNEWTARIWSALFALGAVWSTWLLGRRMFDARTGAIAALALATSTQFLYTHCARTGELDSALLFWFTLALAMLWRGPDDRRSLLLGCLFAGAAGMTKHLAFTVEILGIWGLWLAASGRWRDVSPRALVGGLLLAAAVVAPWHLAMGARHGTWFWDTYMGREMVTRAVSADVPSASPLVYLVHLKDGLYPWSWLLPAAVVALVLRREGGRGGPWLLLLVWCAAIAVVIGPSRVKFSWYALPVYPALCVATARLLTMERRPAWFLPAAMSALALAMMSQSTAWTFNPFLRPAMDGGVGVDLGGWMPWNWPAIWLATCVVVWGGWIVIRARVGNGERTTSTALAVLLLASLLHAVPPLQHASTPTVFSVFVAEVDALVAKDETIGAWYPDGRGPSDLETFYFRRLGRPIRAGTYEGLTHAILCPDLPYIPDPDDPAVPRPSGRVLLERDGYLLVALETADSNTY